MTSEAGTSKALSADRAGQEGPSASVGWSADSCAAGAVPGKTTLSSQVSATDGKQSFDTLHQGAWNGIAALSRSISATNFLCAWSAANELWKALAALEAQVSEDPDAKPQQIRRLGELRSVADPLLALAPRPSPAAIQEVGSKDRTQPRATWDAEERHWTIARGGLAASRAPERATASSESAAAVTGRDRAKADSWLAAFTHHGFPTPARP